MSLRFRCTAKETMCPSPSASNRRSRSRADNRVIRVPAIISARFTSPSPSLSSASQADATILTNAATALGFSQSEGLTRQLQNYLGLDSLTVSSDGGVEESALTIGKYLTPRLYVSYIQELMSPNAGVLLEYSITEKLKVKAESGESQSMDLLLRMEHP